MRNQGVLPVNLNKPIRLGGFGSKNLLREKKIKTINILYLNCTPSVFGAENRLLDAMDFINKQNFKCFALLPQEGMFSKKLQEKKIDVIYLNYTFDFCFKNIPRFIRTTFAFLKIIKEKEIDVIQGNTHFYLENLWLAFLLSRKPLIIFLRSQHWFGLWEKFFIKQASCLLCVSNFIKDHYLKPRRSDCIFGFDERKMQVVYNGFNLDKFKEGLKKNFRQELKIDQDEHLVGLVGAIHPVKGHDIFIEAADIVSRTRPDVKFVIIGDYYNKHRVSQGIMEYKEGLIRLIKRLKLENKVFMTGYREDIADIMHSLDILVQPSQLEALGGSALEAMACGKPVITSKVEGLPEAVGQDGAGILLESRTSQALAEAILYYIENPEEARRAGEIGRQRVEDKFDMAKNVRHLEEVYLKLAV